MHPHIYRLAPELRRSVMIAMVGFAIVSGVAFWVGYVVVGRELAHMVVGCSFFGAISLAMIVPLRWAIYVDGSGVARRWLIGWDLWSWSDFASGRIQKRHAFTFIDPARSWSSGYLTLDLIADDERKRLIELINDHYRLPEAPALPEKLQIQYGFRCSVQFDRQQLRLTIRGETMSFGWSDVKRVRITRLDPVRRDFVGLTLVLPDHEVELCRRKQGSPRWSGATAEEVNEFLLANVARDRIDIDMADECPIRKEDVQKELNLARTNARHLQICMSVIGVFAVALLIYGAISEGAKKILGPTVMFALCFPLFWLVIREYRKNEKRLETWLSEIEAKGAPARTAKW